MKVSNNITYHCHSWQSRFNGTNA